MFSPGCFGVSGNISLTQKAQRSIRLRRFKWVSTHPCTSHARTFNIVRVKITLLFFKFYLRTYVHAHASCASYRVTAHVVIIKIHVRQYIILAEINSLKNNSWSYPLKIPWENTGKMTCIDMQCSLHSSFSNPTSDIMLLFSA